VGAGPFEWQAIELIGGSVDTREEHIALRPFANYHAGKPKLSSFVVRTFRSEAQLVDSFRKKELNAVVGLVKVPDELLNDKSMRVYNLPLTAEVMAFFRNSQEVLSDNKVRQALVQSADTVRIMADLRYPTRPAREPLLPGQLAYNPAYRQAGFDQAAAKATLDGAGWLPGKDGIRQKAGHSLTFKIFAQANGEYGRVATELSRQWREIGVDAKVVLQDDATFQNTLSYHSYDAVIYGISIGVDPDVYAYWHSSQADVRGQVRLNLSEYRSAQADASLEDGRTRLNPELRAVKYRPFLQAWQVDAPALGLYQSRFLYLSRGTVHGLGEHAINSDAERFTNVHNWQIREARQTPAD
jgi:peptide/nickel transport system substrate-binding protein